MPALAAADAPPGAGSRRQALAALCVTEIVSYGVIYYAFPVLFAILAVLAMAAAIAAATGSYPVLFAILAVLAMAGAGLAAAAPVPGGPDGEPGGSGGGRQPGCQPPDPGG